MFSTIFYLQKKLRCLPKKPDTAQMVLPTPKQGGLNFCFWDIQYPMTKSGLMYSVDCGLAQRLNGHEQNHFCNIWTWTYISILIFHYATPSPLPPWLGKRLKGYTSKKLSWDLLQFSEGLFRRFDCGSVTEMFSLIQSYQLVIWLQLVRWSWGKPEQAANCWFTTLYGTQSLSTV